MTSSAAELSRQLSENAEAVCRHYLSNGRKQGHYWLVGDVRNTAGRSMFVRLSGPSSGNHAAGKWTDAATGQHGDLLDVIRESCGLVDFKDVADEARRFLIRLDSILHIHSHQLPPDLRRRRDACLRWACRSAALRWKPICAGVAS